MNDLNILLNMVMASVGFGFWQKSYYAGMFVYGTLLLVWIFVK